MNRLSKLILATAGIVLLASLAGAAPPLPPPPAPSPVPPVRIPPSTPRPAPTFPRMPSGVIILPSTQTIVPVVAVVPVTPIRAMFTVYFRFSPFDPWVRYTSTYSLWRAEAIRDQVEFFYGFEAFVR